MLRGYTMARKLFCEISPLTYKISTQKEILKRNIQDKRAKVNFASEKSANLLPVSVYSHKSLIRRKLGDVDMTLQNNKAVNLAIAAPKVDKIIIRPGQVFSFWHLVGAVSEKQGYKTGLTIKGGNPSSDIGGGMYGHVLAGSDDEHLVGIAAAHRHREPSADYIAKHVIDNDVRFECLVCAFLLELVESRDNAAPRAA